MSEKPPLLDGVGVDIGSAAGKQLLKNIGRSSTLDTDMTPLQPGEVRLLPSGLNETILHKPDQPGEPEKFVTTVHLTTEEATNKGFVVNRPPEFHEYRRAGGQIDERTILKMKLDGKIKNFTSKLLTRMVGVQENLVNRIGLNEANQKNDAYNKAISQYIDLCDKNGISTIDSRMVQINRINSSGKNDRTERSLQTQLPYKEQIFASILSQPFEVLDNAYKTEIEFNEHVLTPLGLSPETYTIDQVLEKIMTTPDTDKLVSTLANGNTDLQQQLLTAIKSHRILGVSLSNQFHWRKFTEILMNGSDQESRRAGRFSAEAGFYQGDNSFEDTVQKAASVLSSIAERGTEYMLVSEEDKLIHDTDGTSYTERTKRSVPVFTPFSLLKDIDNKNNPTFPPKIIIERNGQKTLHEGATMLLQVVEIDENGPGNIIEFANNKANILSKNDMCYSDVPLVAKLVKYKNGEVYFTVVSDHSGMDGEPQANDIVNKFIVEMGHDQSRIPMIQMPDSGTSDVVKLQKLLSLLPADLNTVTSFSELSFPLPVEGIVEFRNFLKDAKKKNIDIVDHKGRIVDLSEYGLGTLCTLLYGNSMLEHAKSTGLTSKDATLGGIGSRKEIDQQLLQVNLNGLQVPEKVSGWFSIDTSENGNKFIRLSEEFVTNVHTANNALTTIGSDRDAMQIVRDVYSLNNKWLWKLNALSASTVLSPLAAENTGKVMISDVNTKVKAGPALVSWQDMAMTLSAIENGYITATAKMRGNTPENMNKGLNVLKTMMFQFFSADQRILPYLESQKQKLYSS